MPLQLDQHRIAIRERSFLEILDLALALIRDRGAGLFAALVAGIVPWALLNDWLLNGWLSAAHLEEGEPAIGFVWWMLLAIAAELPLATAPATIYLGHSVFDDHPGPRLVARDFVRSLPQLLWFQFAWRVPLILSHLFAFVPFVGWPYLTEVIVLERNPLVAKNQHTMTTRRRSKHLHQGSGGNHFSYWLASLAIGAIMTVSLELALWGLLSQLSGRWISGYTALRVFLPAALWLVVAFFTVVRYLLYLNLRIRHEGWEVELALRAEANKLTRQPA